MRNADFGMRQLLKRQQGVSIIAAIFIITILAFMGVMFVSLIGTGSFTAVNDFQSTQALYLAEGGLEYGKEFLRPYSNWYALTTDPVNVATDQALGAGSFTTTINFPATSLSNNLGGGAGNTTIKVRTTNKFPSTFPFFIKIDGEYVSCTASTATTFTCNRAQLNSTIANHFAGATVLPVLNLSLNITNTDTTIRFTGDSSKFLLRGTLNIDDSINGDEEITYSGIQTTPSLAFTGCQRGQNGTTAVAHTASNGDSTTSAYITSIQSTKEAFVNSTGSVSGLNVQRVVSDVADQQ